jgi:predicted Ser/Thr protein kinase
MRNTNTNDMTNIIRITGKTEKEIVALYMGMIDAMMELGANEDQARLMVRESIKESLK